MEKVLIADTPEKIQAWQLLTLKAALKLETLGMRRHGVSAFSIVKKQFGFKGNKKTVLQQYEQYLRDNGILVN